MESLRPYFWAILLLGVIVISLVIILIFIIINSCISRRASSYHTQTQTQTQTKPNHYNDSTFKKKENQVFHKNVENEKPPLPSRDQFQSMDSVDQAYEHVEPLPDYVDIEESTPAETQQHFTPHFAMDETKSQDGLSVEEDYDDVEMPANCDSEDYDDIG